MRRNFFMIANPGAGLGGSPLVERVTAGLRLTGASVICERPSDIHAARHAAQEAAAGGRYDAIVAAGGDGTIRQVAAALLGAATPLGIVPVGTGNVLAHEIGLAANAEAIVPMLLYGPAASVSLARANGDPFLLMAGVGFDGRVIAALNHRLKSYVGKAAYAGPILGALVRSVDTLNVTLDGHHHEASWAIVSNARHYGGRFVLAPHTGIQKRGLQAVLFKARNRAVLMGQVFSLVMGRLGERAAIQGDVAMLACTSATITARHPVPTQIDGDLLGHTPLQVESEAGELRLIVPGSAAPLDLASH